MRDLKWWIHTVVGASQSDGLGHVVFDSGTGVLLIVKTESADMMEELVSVADKEEKERKARHCSLCKDVLESTKEMVVQ